MGCTCDRLLPNVTMDDAETRVRASASMAAIENSDLKPIAAHVRDTLHTAEDAA